LHTKRTGLHYDQAGSISNAKKLLESVHRKDRKEREDWTDSRKVNRLRDVDMIAGGVRKVGKKERRGVML